MKKFYLLFLVLLAPIMMGAVYFSPTHQGLVTKYNEITSNNSTTTFAATDDQKVIVSGTGSQTLRLPDATTLPTGWWYQIYVFTNPGTVDIDDGSGSSLTTSVGQNTIVFLELTSNASVAGQWKLVTNSTGVTDHGNLGGLTDDDHTQYMVNDPSTQARNTIDLTSDVPALTLQAVENQTDNLLELQSSDGSIIASMDPVGGVTFSNITSGIATSNNGKIDSVSSINIDQVQAPSGDANEVAILSGTGVLTSETALAETRGGTGQSSYTTGDMLYSDSSNSLDKLGIGSNGQFLSITGGIPSWEDLTAGAVGVQSEKTSNYNISATDGFIRGDATSGEISLELPDVDSTTDGTVIYVKKTDTSTNPVVLNTYGGSQLIDGNPEYELKVASQSVAVIDTGSIWSVLQSHPGANLYTIQVNGTSGTPVVTKQTGDWVASITDSGVGRYTLVFKTNTFSGAPYCTCIGSGGSAYACSTNGFGSSASLEFDNYSISGSALADERIQVYCRDIR